MMTFKEGLALAVCLLVGLAGGYLLPHPTQNTISSEVESEPQEPKEGHPIDTAFSQFYDAIEQPRNEELCAFIYADQWYNQWQICQTAAGEVTYSQAPYNLRNLEKHADTTAQFYAYADYYKQSALRMDPALETNPTDITDRIGQMQERYACTFGTDDMTGFLEVAALEEDDIMLYQADDFGMILSVNGRRELMPWTGIGPRRILPKMMFADLDGDGEKELAVSLYKGGGLGRVFFGFSELCGCV